MADFELIKLIVLEAVEYFDLTAREQYLEAVCTGDPELRREVDSLLSCRDSDVTLLGNPIFDCKKPPRSPLPDWLSPRARIGHYIIEEIVGRGGMAVVALATRGDDFEKRVAIKVVLPWMVSENALTRFRNERQILAGLEHPHIARVYDGGDTDDGWPYLVMEYVEGEPISTHCQRTGGGINDKLRLVLQVCSALEYAHKKLVVHRDLKPGNIYVDSDRNIKVLDFGIAKSLDDQPAELARWPQAPMTLKYASPEQIEGGQLTPAADIYSVGVLMYELLTGQHPHAGDAPIGSRLAKAICETDPPLPSSVARSSSLRKTLAGDLDSIVLKAMRRAPTERYGSVRQLSEDIGRFIGGKPILARNSTWPYRASKFVGRYRLGLGLSAALALLFVAFSSFLLFAWRSSLQKKEAELRRQSEELAYEYTRRGEALELIRGLLKATATRRPAEVELTLAEILTNDEKDIEQEVQDPLLQADMIPAVAQTLRNLGLYASEFELLEAIEVKVREKNRRDTESLARALNNIGVLFFQLDNHERAEALYRESLGLKRLSIHDDENIDTTKVASNLATLLSRRGHYEEAQRLYREVIDLRTRRFGSEHSAVATSLRSLGSLHYALGNYEKAEALFANQRLLDNTGDFGVDLEDAVSQRVSLRRKEYREVVGILCASDAMHTASMSDRLPRFAAYDVGESGIYVTAGVLADAKQPESERIRLRLVNRASELLRLTGTRGLLGHYLFQMSKYATDPSMSGDAFVDSQRERPATPTRPLEADP